MQYQVIFDTSYTPNNSFVGIVKQYSNNQYSLKVFLPSGFDTGYQITANIKRADGQVGSYALSWSTDHWALSFGAWTTDIAGELQLTIQAVASNDDIVVFKSILFNVEETVAVSDYDPPTDGPEYTTILAAIATKQNADADLTAIAGLTGTGVPKRTGTNEWELSQNYFELVGGLVPAEYLPSYVDDVIEGIYVNSTTFTVGGVAVTPEAGKLYVSTTNERVYRWSGSLFVEVSAQITVGNLTGQAFDGALGKAAYDNAANAVSWGNHANAGYLKGDSQAITDITNFANSTASNLGNLTNSVGNLTNEVSDLGNLVTTINGSYLTASSSTITDLNNGINSTNNNVANLTNVVANKVNTSLLGQPNGVATLDEAGLIPSGQLPSYVDDVLEFANLASFPEVGESGKIYVSIHSSLTYRWSGTQYVEISPSLALGNTSTTAFRGDLGKEAYDWGNHANAGYLTTEADTLDSVATRGNTTNTATINFATTNEITFDTTTDRGTDKGKLGWNTSDSTLQVGLGNNVVLQLGQETLYVVRNATGSTILNGTPVYCTGVTASGRLEVSPSTNTIDPVTFLGIATQDINNGVNGKVTHFGYVRGLDTRGTAATAISVGDEDWAEGDKLYIHPSVAGKLTKVEPEAPNVKICVAVVVIRHQTTGVLFVRPTSNLDIKKLSDVQISNVANGEVLSYNGTSARWENKEVVSLGLNVALTNIANDQYLAYQDGTWVNRDLVVYGTVNSVGINTTTTALTVNGTVTNTGNLSVDVASGYVIPTTTEQTNWNSAYSWGNHQAVGYIVGLANDTVTNGNLALWNGTTGKLLQDGAVALQTTLSNDSTKVPTSSAVSTYVDGVVGDIETILDDIIGGE